MPETLPYINEIFFESRCHILNMAILHCLTTNQLIRNKNEMSVQPHRATSIMSLCFLHYLSLLDLSVPLNSLLSSSSD